MKILTITGPTCSGKSTLERALADHFEFGRCISHTTRTRRKNEVHSIDYYFCSKTFFDRREDFLEHVTYDHNMYGIHSSEIDRLSGIGGFKRIVAVVEPIGMHQIRDWCRRNDHEHEAVFIDVPMFIRTHRLVQRFNCETNPAIDVYQRRMETMVKECEWESCSPYHVLKPTFEYIEGGHIGSEYPRDLAYRMLKQVGWED